MGPYYHSVLQRYLSAFFAIMPGVFGEPFKHSVTGRAEKEQTDGGLTRVSKLAEKVRQLNLSRIKLPPEMNDMDMTRA